jgi:hypothetical protein
MDCPRVATLMPAQTPCSGDPATPVGRGLDVFPGRLLRNRRTRGRLDGEPKMTSVSAGHQGWGGGEGIRTPDFLLRVRGSLPLCSAAFPQVAPDRQGRSWAFWSTRQPHKVSATGHCPAPPSARRGSADFAPHLDGRGPGGPRGCGGPARTGRGRRHTAPGHAGSSPHCRGDQQGPVPPRLTSVLTELH